MARVEHLEGSDRGTRRCEMYEEKEAAWIQAKEVARKISRISDEQASTNKTEAVSRTIGGNEIAR